MPVKAQSRRYDISMLRVISMFLIILCHIIRNYTFIPFSNRLSEVFNAGVYTFLGISGYLFGMKRIKRFIPWVIARIKKIWLPVFIIVIIDITCLSIFSNEKISIRQCITYVLNLQGLMFLDWRRFTGLLGGEITNLGPLWFMTVIMLCYLCVPVLQWVRESANRDNHIIYIIVLFCLYTAFGMIELCIGFHGFYFAAFIAGYFLSSYHENGKRLGNVIVILICCAVLLMQVVRLFMQKAIDDSVVYLTYIGFSHSFLGLSLLLVVTEVYQANKRFFLFGNNIVIQILDKYSVYIYLVHQLFCSRPWNVYDRFTLGVGTILFFVFTAASAFVLRMITDNVLRILTVFVTKFAKV